MQDVSDAQLQLRFLFKIKTSKSLELSSTFPFVSNPCSQEADGAEVQRGEAHAQQGQQPEDICV